MTDANSITVTTVLSQDEILMDCTACGPLAPVPVPNAGRIVAEHLAAHGCDMEQMVVETHEQEDRPE